MENKTIFLVRSDRSGEGNYTIIGVFYNATDAYYFANLRRSATPIDVMKVEYDNNGVVRSSVIEYI